ncbi:SDR family oxidoreductase [Bifidobacterium sp. 82T24]|uniref:SDR family NAD(P)-dependent oxidoreductase n=1 Tax=Bifidobacterium pluvialisilvae TaxID=2834436 RepID=UPI001C587DBD|nr:SDR family oxidoreductase [Bifidobacterium pluvialisilvae]MBW3087584.1 SDR family oxidoreductase [Bifidobacterium pluvialisilvae]
MKKPFEGRFDGKVMIITGAALGIGEATALRAAQEGASLVLVDKLEEEGQDILRRVRDLGAQAVFLHGDVSEEETCKAMVELAVKTFGRLDIAINNAGIMGQPGRIVDVTKEQLDHTMANNFYSVFFSCKYEVIEFLKEEHGGSIVNVASIAGLTGLPGNLPYSASKHAVNGLTKNVAIDYARKGIRVNSVNPAGTTTPLTKAAYEYVKRHYEQAIAAGMDPKEAKSMAGLKTRSLLEREAQPDEQASAILFLASDDASFFTAATIAPDGGWTSF